MGFELEQMLMDSGALLEGHFLLTSGRHSDRYIEKFRLLERPAALDAAARAMAAGIEPADVDVVLGAAIGGILIAGSVARILDRRTMFTERVTGKMTLRRGFKLRPADRVLVVEDIVSTGGSLLELLAVVKDSGATIARVACLVDRTIAGLSLDAPTLVLHRMPIASWSRVDCPLCSKNIPLTKPGRSGK